VDPVSSKILEFANLMNGNLLKLLVKNSIALCLIIYFLR